MTTLQDSINRLLRKKMGHLARLPQTYAPTVPAWIRQAETLSTPVRGAHASALCDGYQLARAAYGATRVRGMAAFGYLWRRFGPPWFGSDPDKDLARYVLTTSHPDILLTLDLSAASLLYAVGYLIAPSVEIAWQAPLGAWEASFETWWVATKLTPTEQQTLRESKEHAGISPVLNALAQRFWTARREQTVIAEAEQAIGPYPCDRKYGGHPEMEQVLHATLIECLRPVFIRDVAINILGHVPDGALDERAICSASVYAGYGMPKEPMDALYAERKEETVRTRPHKATWRWVRD